MAAPETTDFLRKAEQLRKLADKHKKETKLKYYSGKSDLRDCFCPLLECENKLNSELKAEILRVQQQLQKIRNGVCRFQGQLIDVKPSPDLIAKLKEIMTEIENSMNNFKAQQHCGFEELLKEERTCWQEMTALEKKINAWSLSVKTNGELHITPKARLYSGKQDREGLPMEVVELEKFLQRTGGELGGWDQYDHDSFLHVWTKHHGKPAYRAEVKTYLPSRTEEDIEQHENWYYELCRLQEKKKEDSKHLDAHSFMDKQNNICHDMSDAIKKWRANKQRERQARLQREQQENGFDGEERDAAEAQRFKQLEEERREAAIRLEAWREQRRQQQQQEEEQRLREEALQRKRLQEERRRQLEVKMAVEEHLRQKREEEELCLRLRQEQEQTEMEERQRLAAEGIRHFQERDLQKLETKLKEKQTKEEGELERLRKQAKLKEKVESSICRDPSRLCKPTKGWEERTKEIGPTGGGPIYQMFHRAVPSWRQGL